MRKRNWVFYSQILGSSVLQRAQYIDTVSLRVLQISSPKDQIPERSTMHYPLPSKLLEAVLRQT